MAMAAGAEARADQGEVWREVAARADRHAIVSPTGAMDDLFEDCSPRLDDLHGGFRRLDGQLGALACIGGKPLVLDYVSRSDVFAALWAPLLRGYLLDAMEHDGDAPAHPRIAASFLSTLRGSQVQTRPGIGLGSTFALRAGRAGGTGLEHEGELVQLSAFAARR
jgi:hypothetical protein